MAAFPVLQFVTRPYLDADVRYDFQAAPAQVQIDGFTIGAPGLTGDPAAIGRQWGDRRLTMTQAIVGDEDAAAPLRTTLAKELLRPYNWLLYQHDAFSRPVWFRTYMTQPGEIDFGNVYVDEDGYSTGNSQWQLSVTVDADPWAYGEEVTLAIATINNSPAAGSNPCLLVLPDIVGDAPTPMRVRIKSATAANREAATGLLSVIASDLAPTGQLIAPPVDVGNDTTFNASGDTTFVGDNWHEITFATHTDTVSRIRYGSLVLQHGSYKALLRCRSGAAAVFDLQLANPSDMTVLAETVGAFDTSGENRWFDLGVIDWPPGARIDDEFLDTGAASSISFNLRAGRMAGAGSLYVDCLVLVPVVMDDGDADTLVLTYPDSTDAPDAVYVDGRTKSARLVTSADVPLQTTKPAQARGQFPRLVPGKQNVLRFFQTLESPNVATGDAELDSATLVVSYRPQWLFLADQ